MTIRIFYSFICAALISLSANSVSAREHVAFDSTYAPGTVVIVTHQRRLYFVTDQGRAIRYPVGVGKAGAQWRGTAVIDGKHLNPAWAPHPDMLRGRAPYVIPGGAPNNPMGAAALTLSGDEYAIHGTTQSMRSSVGSFASAGCIRMLNEDVMDLYDRVQVGTTVVVLP